MSDERNWSTPHDEVPPYQESEMEKEITRLRQRVKELEDERDIFKRTLNKRDGRVEELEAKIEFQDSIIEDCALQIESLEKDAERWRESQELGMVSWDDIIEAIGDWGGPEHECFNLAIRMIKQQQVERADPDDDFTRGEHDL